MADLLGVLRIKDSNGNWVSVPGLKGDTGEPFKILGIYATAAALEADVEDPGVGDVYLVGTTGAYDIYLYLADGWHNTGRYMPKGDTGDPAPAAAITSAVETWLAANVDPETGYVLDRSLSMENAAAPADLVGDFKSLIAIVGKADASPVDLKPFLNIDEYVDNSGQSGPSTVSKRTKFIPIYKGWTVSFGGATATATGNVFSFYTSESESDYVPESGVPGQGGNRTINGSYTAQSDGYFRLSCRNDSVSGAKFTIQSAVNETIEDISVLVGNGFKYFEKSGGFLQGYYNASGSFVSAQSYACTEIIAPTDTEMFKVPVSQNYDISIYSWDYDNGAYSNFTQTGWIAADTEVVVPQGKAMSILLRNAGGSGPISSGLVEYTYYQYIASEKINIMLKEWKPNKVACVGDSLTKGVDTGSHVIAENYPYFMSKMLGCNVLNYGVSGADPKEYWNDNINGYTFDSTIDTVLIMLGTNGGVPDTLETDVFPYTDYEDYADTLCGCYCKIIRYIIEQTSNIAQVILITPPYSTYSTEQLNRVKTARETIMKIGEYFNIPVIDVFAECGMGAYNASTFRPHDGCHFNAKGYHRLGTFIGSKVKSMHSEWSLDDVYPDETPVP